MFDSWAGNLSPMDYDVFAGNQHTNTPTHGIYHTAKDTTYFLIFNFPSHIYLYTCSYLYILSSFYPLSPYPFPSLIVPCYYDYFDVLTAPYQRKVIEKIKKNHPTVPTIMYINKVMSPPSTHHNPTPLHHNHHQSYPTPLIKKNHPTVPTIMYINKVMSPPSTHHHPSPLNHNHHQSYPTLLIKKNHPTVPTIMYINKVYSTSI